LDRIVAIYQAPVEYVATDIDFEEYFDDVIGVTFPKDKNLEAVQLKFSESRFPYVTSKPIHWSQKIIDVENRIIEIDVIPNNELTALLLSYGSDVEVIAPESVRDDIKFITQESFKNYSMCADRLH
jgi:predicted DNA-binding transcriptional regulator YafY